MSTRSRMLLGSNVARWLSIVSWKNSPISNRFCGLKSYFISPYKENTPHPTPKSYANSVTETKMKFLSSWHNVLCNWFEQFSNTLNDNISIKLPRDFFIANSMCQNYSWEINTVVSTSIINPTR
jgi:hypothetical protein